MKKRMISSILTLCIAVSLVLPVYAADNSVSSKIDQVLHYYKNKNNILPSSSSIHYEKSYCFIIYYSIGLFRTVIYQFNVFLFVCFLLLYY